jgi:hypothetical protein
MSAAMRKIVVFLSLIAFTLSTIIGLASGYQISTVIFRGLVVLLLFVAVGWLLAPLFVKLWGEDAQLNTEFETVKEEESSEDE